MQKNQRETTTDQQIELERLPHRPPMRLIVAVEARSAEAVLCRASVPQSYPIAWPGAVPPVVAVEIAAQASALLLAPEASEAIGKADPGRVGYLVSIRRISFSCQAIPTETPLLVRAFSTGQAGPLQMIRFEVMPDLIRRQERDELLTKIDLALPLTGDSLLASGTLGTFQGDREPE